MKQSTHFCNITPKADLFKVSRICIVYICPVVEGLCVCASVDMHALFVSLCTYDVNKVECVCVCVCAACLPTMWYLVMSGGAQSSRTDWSWLISIPLRHYVTLVRLFVILSCASGPDTVCVFWTLYFGSKIAVYSTDFCLWLGLSFSLLRRELKRPNAHLLRRSQSFLQWEIVLVGCLGVYE